MEPLEASAMNRTDKNSKLEASRVKKDDWNFQRLAPAQIFCYHLIDQLFLHRKREQRQVKSSHYVSAKQKGRKIWPKNEPEILTETIKSQRSHWRPGSKFKIGLFSPFLINRKVFQLSQDESLWQWWLPNLPIFSLARCSVVHFWKIFTKL